MVEAANRREHELSRTRIDIPVVSRHPEAGWQGLVLEDQFPILLILLSLILLTTMHQAQALVQVLEALFLLLRPLLTTMHLSPRLAQEPGASWLELVPVETKV
jgi:hypothetical protein